jgi:hypothetical protein
MIQPESPRTRAAFAGTGITPAVMFRMVTQTKSGIMAAHTIMQNGQRMWIEYRAWDHSHTTSANPRVTPACRPSQYQRANVAPASRAMPTVMMMAKATMPMNMLGKPNSELCHVCITCPQEIHGFTSHTVVWFGSLRTSSFSRTKVPEASQPMVPVTTSSQPKGRFRVMGGTAPAVLAAGSLSWFRLRSGAGVPLRGEMLGIGMASFSSGAPCPDCNAGRWKDRPGMPGPGARRSPASAAFYPGCERMNVAGSRTTFGLRSGGLFPRPPMMSRAGIGYTEAVSRDSIGRHLVVACRTTGF